MRNDDWITVPEAGRRLGVSRNTAYRAAELGQIPIVRIGKLLRVPLPAFRRLLAGKPLPKRSSESPK